MPDFVLWFQFHFLLPICSFYTVFTVVVTVFGHANVLMLEIAIKKLMTA
jgi:hypothetical protein